MVFNKNRCQVSPTWFGWATVVAATSDNTGYWLFVEAVNRGDTGVDAESDIAPAIDRCDGGLAAWPPWISPQLAVDEVWCFDEQIALEEADGRAATAFEPLLGLDELGEDVDDVLGSFFLRS